MNIITKLNDLITKNFNNYLKNYFNNMNYVDKQGSFSNYYNFINDLDSFNDSFKSFAPYGSNPTIGSSIIKSFGS